MRRSVALAAAAVIVLAGCSSSKTPTEMTNEQVAWCAGHISQAQAEAIDQKTGIDVLRLYAPLTRMDVAHGPGSPIWEAIRTNRDLTRACLAVPGHP